MGRTVIDGDFEWDEDKAIENAAKHKVSFHEAASVFADPLACVEGSVVAGEQRLEVIGVSGRGSTLFVVSCERDVDRDTTRIRIISARTATKQERSNYEGK